MSGRLLSFELRDVLAFTDDDLGASFRRWRRLNRLGIAGQIGVPRMIGLRQSTGAHHAGVARAVAGW